MAKTIVDREENTALRKENEELREALRRLLNEAVHYRNTPNSPKFLDLAVKDSRRLLAR
jgi:hypothetical protein